MLIENSKKTIFISKTSENETKIFMKTHIKHNETYCIK